MAYRNPKASVLLGHGDLEVIGTFPRIGCEKR